MSRAARAGAATTRGKRRWPAAARGLGALVLCALAAPPVAVAARAVGSVPAWLHEGDQTDCRYGTVARAGDVNGDGYADILVGSYRYSLPELHEGVVFVHHGSAAGLAASPACTLQVDQAECRFGDKLGTAGDVNGDGYDDVVVGAANYSNGQPGEGKAFLFLGGPQGLSRTPAWSAELNQAGAEFGANMATAGDVNGDGFADVVVGSWLYDHGQLDEGGAFLYLGSDSGLADTPAWTAESNSASAVFGYRANAAGDVNGDGFGDVVVGARRYSGDGLTREGRAYLYLGGPSGLAATPAWTHDGDRAEAEFGNTVGAAGDIDGDGFDDLVVGAFRWDGPETNEGKVFVFRGGPAGADSLPGWTYEANVPNEYVGYHCPGAGDVNGDGHADFLVGVAEHDAGALANAGQALLFLGGPAGPGAIPAWEQEGDQNGEQFGNSLSSAGDVNGDGYDDFLVASLYRDNAWIDSGRAMLFMGGPAGVTSAPEAPGRPVQLAAGPCPSRGELSIAFALRRGGRVRLTLEDIAGRTAAVLSDEFVPAGAQRRAAATRGLAPGVYFLRLVLDGRSLATTRVVHIP